MNDRASEDLIINERLRIPAWELSWSTTRSGGPGGQHVNTTNSCVLLHWSVDAASTLSQADKARVRAKLANRIDQSGVLTVRCDTHRSQLRNRELARERLAALLSDALRRERRRVATRPTRGSVERRLESKRETSQRKKLRRKPDDS